MTKPYADREIWFLTGSQDLYGEETLRQVAEQSQAIARQLDESAEIPVKVVWKPVLKSSDAIRRAALDDLTKGASGGALQSANVALGPEPSRPER